MWKQHNNRKKMYICHTPYHLLIAIVKQLIEKSKSDLVLCREELIGSDTIVRLKNQNVFESIKVYSSLDSRRDLLKDEREVLFHRKRMNMDIEHVVEIKVKDLKEYDIYIFNDSSVFGYWMNMNGVKYHLLEDGLNTYQTEGQEKAGLKKRVKTIIKRWLRVDFSYWGASGNYLTIEVNDIHGIKLKEMRKVVAVPRKDLLSKLSNEDKELIRKVFLGDKLLLSGEMKEGTLLITQPLSEDKEISHEKKMRIYKYLIKKYGEKQIYIKPHPREEDQYEEFEDCIVIPAKTVPLEVLNIMPDVHFIRAITCYSTAILELENVEDKVIMGYEWVQNFSDNDFNVDITTPALS